MSHLLFLSTLIASSLALSCNYRVDNDSFFQTAIVPMGCDFMHPINYTCINTTHVLQTNYSTRGCTGIPTAAFIVPASSVYVHCGGIDCFAKQLDYHMSSKCNDLTAHAVEYVYTGDKCQSNAMGGSLYRTCDSNHSYLFEFADPNCDPLQQTLTTKRGLNICGSIYGEVNHSFDTTCENPQNHIPAPVASNPAIYEDTWFSDAACQAPFPASTATSFLARRECYPDPLLNMSHETSCDNKYEWKNYYTGPNCVEAALESRSGTVTSGVCVKGRIRKCLTTFGPNFKNLKIAIENFNDAACSIPSTNYSIVDEYAAEACLWTGIQFSCAPNATQLIRHGCGSFSINETVFELGKCIKNPELDSPIPYVRVTGCVPAAPSKGDSPVASSAPIVIGICAALVLIVGVCLIYYRRMKLNEENEIVSLLDENNVNAPTRPAKDTATAEDAGRSEYQAIGP